MGAGGFVAQVEFLDVSSFLDVNQLAVLSEGGMEQESVIIEQLGISDGPGDSTAEEDLGEFWLVFVIYIEEGGSALKIISSNNFKDFLPEWLPRSCCRL